MAAKSSANLRGCVAAVDGMAIKIEAPDISQDARPARFYCRKGFFSLNLQAVCDSSRKFLAAYIDCPGSVNDALAWKYTNLYQQLEAGKLPYPYWIAGDAAYGCTNYLLSPFPGKSCSKFEDSFNFHQSQQRINIECAFGMLVSRWGVLWKPLRCKLTRAPLVVGVCMKLHNLIVDETNGRLTCVCLIH